MLEQPTGWRLALRFEAERQEESLAVSFNPVQKGIEADEANFPDLREFYLHETKG